MEADLIELFEIFRTILEQCREVVIVEADLDICKKLQTKIGISLTMMKQIDFGDVVVQTFMSDLDFFSTILETILESFRASTLPSLEVFQEYRGQMIQAVVKLIVSTKEFYLTKVEYVASDVVELPVSSRYDLADSEALDKPTTAAFDLPAMGAKPRVYRLEEDSVIALPKYRSNTVFADEVGGRPSVTRKADRERELESLHLNDMPRNFGKYGGWSKARHKRSTPDAKALPAKPTAMALSEDMKVALKPSVPERVETPLAAQMRRGTIFDQDDHLIIQRITQLNLLSTAAKKISANSFLLDGLDEQHEKEKHLELASKIDKKLQALRKSHSFSIRNRKKYNCLKKKQKRASCPSLDDLRQSDRVHSDADTRRERRITVMTNPTTGRTYKRYALDNVEVQLGIVSDKQRAQTLVNEQRGYGLMPSRSTTAMMNYARDPEVKNVTQIISKSVSKQNLIQERNLCDQAEAAYKRLLEISAAFSEKNASFPDIRSTSRVYIREAFVYISPFAKERKQFHAVLCNDLLLLMECVKPYYGLGIQIRVNDWSVKSMPVERKREEESFPCAIVSQKLKKIYRIYFETSVMRSQWIVDLLSAISGGFDHLSLDKQIPSKPSAVKKDSSRSPLMESDGRTKPTKVTYDASLDEKKLFTNFMVAGVIGALNDIPRDMFVVFLLTGEKKTVPCIPTQCIRQTIEKIARHFALDMNACTVYTESGEEISLDKKFSEIPGRSVVLASNVLLKTMYTSFSFQRKGVESQGTKRSKGLIRKVSFKEKGSVTSSQKNTSTNQNRASTSLKPSLSAPDLISTRPTRSTSSPPVPTLRQSKEEEFPAPKSPRKVSLANTSSTNVTHAPTHTHAPQPLPRPPVSAVNTNSTTSSPTSTTNPSPTPVANSVNNIKRSTRSISLGLNRVEQINKAAQATAMANDTLAKNRVDSRSNSRPGSPRDIVIPPLNIPHSPTTAERLAHAQAQPTQAQNDDSEDSSEMYRSYAMANIDINKLYTSPIQIKKDAELFAQDLLSPRGVGMDTSEFFGEDCYGVVSWKDSNEKVKFHQDEALQRALDREKERVANAPAPLTAVLTAPIKEDDNVSNKSKWRSSSKKKLKSRKIEETAAKKEKLSSPKPSRGKKGLEKSPSSENLHAAQAKQGLVGALNEIPQNMCVVMFPSGRKTIPFQPGQTIRDALESRCRGMGLRLDDFVAKDENHKVLKFETRMNTIEARFISLETVGHLY